MPKITAIHGGGDWYDASVDYLILPDDMDIEKERIKREAWYKVYCKNLRTSLRNEYISFVEWLILAGAREPTEDELEIVET